ncbi:MAG TPA: TonB-dependent receptor plug domain-containing protein [Candidatus Angelobacter sp.]|nr:TonB-dependent receptor plug domain-containing protein [Candidatus Angelobacter sp.]
MRHHFRGTHLRALQIAVLAFILLFATFAFAAPTGAIYGTIRDQQGAVIPNATVDLMQAGRKVASVVTDHAGNYRFPHVAVGIYQVHATAAGFSAQQSEQISLSLNSSPMINFVLPVGAVADQIVVTATGTPIPESQVGASVSVISRDRFQDRMDILEPLEQVPGVQVVQSGQRGAETSIFIRGGNSNANKVLLDGVPLNDIGGVVNLGNLATMGIQEFEVLRGPNSVLYGPDAMAGVVSLTTRRGTTETPELSYSFDAGNFSTRRNDGSLSGVFHRLDYLGEISRSDTNNSVPNSRYHDGTYVANVGLALTSTTELRFTGRYITAALGQPNAIQFFGIPDDSFEKDQDAFLGVTLQNQTTERWHNLLRYGVARLRLQDVNPTPTGIPFDNGFGGGINFLGLPVTIRGANGFSVNGQAILDFAGTYPIETSSSSKRDSVYFQSDYSFNSHLTGLIAFRFENERGFTLSFGSSTPADRDNFSYIAEVHGNFGRAHLTLGGSLERNAVFGTAAIPRGSLAYYLIRPRSSGRLAGTRLNFNFGQGIREPSIFETNSSLFDLLSQTGAPQLIPQFHIGPIVAERSRSYDAGFDQFLAGGRVKLSGTFFYNQFTNQIEFVPNTAFPLLGIPAAVTAQAGFGATINSGDTRALGAEAEIYAALGHGVTARAGYTYLDDVVQRSFTSDASACAFVDLQSFCAFNPAFPGIPIGAFAPLVGARPFRRAPHTGNLTLGYSGERVDLSVTGYFVSRRDDSTLLSDAFFGTTLLLPNRNLAPAWQKIDFGGAYRLSPHVRLFTVIENLASQHYDPAFGFSALPLSFRAGFNVTIGGGEPRNTAK